jgi:TonB-dependent SusC/RagA subfamily outer membrane receptor
MRKFLLMAVTLLSVMFASAQTHTVKGRVLSEDGIPVGGASIAVKGTASGTISDDSGYYRLDVAPGRVLQISAINYKPEEVAVGNSSNLVIHLISITGTMDEVIVTAGGIRSSRKQQGTANTVIKAGTLTAGKAVNIAGGLQGKVAGLQINATSGGVNPNYRLILRGQRSLTGNNQALIVLDNVIVPNTVLGNLNPEDVSEVVVLNGSGAAALYGSQASNGAIIVTTKKGVNGLTQVRISNTTTIESVAFFPKIQ